jgi:prepilin-type N-terminal cleavage/methylation domain-containing protein
MKDRKGFSLVEITIAIAIVATLAAILIPSYSKYAANSKETACKVSCQEFVSAFKVFNALHNNSYSIEDALNGAIPEMVPYADDFQCPSGGTITVEDDYITCSIHGQLLYIGDADPSPIPGSSPSPSPSLSPSPSAEPDILVAGDVIFDNIPLSSWEKVCSDTSALPWGGTIIAHGTVYVYDGETYVVKYDSYLSKADAAKYDDNPAGVSFLLNFDSTSFIDSSSYSSWYGWNPSLTQGTVFYEQGAAYVFLGSYTTRWEVLPTQGGNWVKLA